MQPVQIVLLVWRLLMPNYVLLSIVFNAGIIHVYLPDELMLTIIVPIIKDQKGVLTDVNNSVMEINSRLKSKLVE